MPKTPAVHQGVSMTTRNRNAASSSTDQGGLPEDKHFLLGNISRKMEVKMAKKIPVVSDDALFDPRTCEPDIRLDSPAWFAWLDAPTTTSFSYALFNRAQGYFDGFMTLRKERRQRGGAYWSVYRRQGRRLHKHYVGPSAALTKAQLAQLAAQVRACTEP